MSSTSASIVAFACFALTGAGCELIASVDPSLIEGSGGAPAASSTSGSGGAGGVGGAGAATSSTGTGGAACGTDADCPKVAEDCYVAKCTIEPGKPGVCGKAPAPLGAVSANQTDGDCQRLVCDASGTTTIETDDTDVPADDGNDCTDACKNGVANAKTSAGAACTSNGGKVCDGSGACVACNVDADCNDVSKVCTAHVCVAAPTCNDAVQNGAETDIDCGGGTCGKCADTKKCLVAADCQSGMCTGGTCQGR